jgi:hypothetical protein
MMRWTGHVTLMGTPEMLTKMVGNLKGRYLLKDLIIDEILRRNI